MKIETLKVNRRYMYIWLKKVEGVDLDKHCARCLLGEYDNRISKSTLEEHDLELQDGIYYLCGVTYPYKWADNFHLAFRNKKGSNISYEYQGIRVEIKDAERLPIDARYINQSNKHTGQKAYSTCRNWQFANYYKDHIEGVKHG